MYSINLIVFLVTCFFIHTFAEEDFLGCGGFVQVDKAVGLDLSKVEIRLYTKQGNLKYHTDCAPNNGYYFIPIYDKGEYVIKVVSPNGWSFKPSSFPVNIDRETDWCSQGKDINFVFQGFSINGKVISHGRSSGPAGVKLQLLADDTNDVLQSILSEKQGEFSFKNIAPGKYLVRASHPEWRLSSSEVKINVQSDSQSIVEGLVILGYPVEGQVISEGEPIQNVIFSLYSRDEDATSHCGLDAPSVSSPVQDESGWNLVCQTSSDLKGQFHFPVVQPGHYKIVPLYQGENIRFDITPATFDFDVEDSRLIMTQKFEVQGFRVSGRVLEHPSGSGLVGAKVYLNDKQVAITGDEGSYNLENIKTGMYRLTAESDHLGFERLSVRISPNTPSLPDIVASSYRVCGQIELSDLAVGPKARQVIFIPTSVKDSSAEPVLLSTDDTGVFCQLLKPGTYKLEPMALESEVAAGLKFVPASHEIVVKQEALSGFSFSQFRASIRGKIMVIGTASNVPVRLTSVSQPTRLVQPVEAIAGADGTFEFSQLLPGKYRLSVLQDDWCWKSKTIDVELVDSDQSDLVFEQTGFAFAISSSHEVDLTFTVDGEGSDELLTVKAGVSKHCLPRAGHYVFTPKSCHVFDAPSVEWNSDKPMLVHLKSVSHRVGVIVRSDHEVADLSVTATSSNGGTTPLVLESVEKPSENEYQHQFVFNAPSGETLQVVATAESLLFFPSTLSLTVGRECDDKAGTIIAQRGLYVSGSVRPAISDVEVTISGGRLSQPVTVETDSNGQYVYGPVNLDGHPILDLAATFTVEAKKRGYIVRPAKAFGDFIAEKLAEISVLVVDSATGQPLPSVLVAAAGGVGYRQNSQTGPDGRVTLSSLNPGEYFIKPVLKEYRFDPSSKLIEIEDGATVELQIKGERVAFSCFGSVTALNGEPEGSVSVEAVGTGPSHCAEYQEDATSEANGQFRIRGLLPGCEYTVRMKTGNGFNKNVERTLPLSTNVKVDNSDVSGLRFSVIKAVNQADVVVTLDVLEPEHLRTIKLNLFREDQPGVVLQSLKLDNSPLVVLPVLPMDGRKYFIQLESNLGRHHFDYQMPELSFTANTSVQHLSMRFHPRRKTVDASETTQVSIRGVLVALLVGLAAYYREELGPFINRVLAVVNNALKPNRGGFAFGSGLSGASSSSGHPNNPVFSEQELALMDEGNNVTKKRVKPRRAQ